MTLFKDKKKPVKDKSIPAAAPEEAESAGEIEHSEENKEVEKEIEEDTREQQYQQVPVCMSRTQLDNMNVETNIIVKENNIMLKELIIRSEEE